MLLRKQWMSRPGNVLYALLFATLTVWILMRLHFPWASHMRSGALIREHVQRGRGVGGRWYIPDSWSKAQLSPLTNDSTILEAAEYAFELAQQRQAFIKQSNIPLFVHQTWRTLNVDEWSDLIQESAEKWLDAAVSEQEMAWFLWDDDGIDQLMQKYEPEWYGDFKGLPKPVLKADIFRVVVLKWFGGVYADIDSQPLKHPFDWIYDTDLFDWSDSRNTYSLHKPNTATFGYIGDGPDSYDNIYFPETENVPGVNAIFGIGADNLPDPDDTYWRMGYTFPVQITNWASSMAPHHPVAYQFISALRAQITREQASNNLPHVDPLNITGPPALTAAIREVVWQNQPDFDWDALSWRRDDPEIVSGGGRGKVVAGDVLVLPITGFNPGRGWFQNMGSKSISHQNARLRHEAAGSWRGMNIKVHYGKLCRQLFGMCKDWPKIP